MAVCISSGCAFHVPKPIIGTEISGERWTCCILCNLALALAKSARVKLDNAWSDLRVIYPPVINKVGRAMITAHN